MERITGYHALESRYFQRMDNSAGDKSRLIKYLPPIVDPSNPPHVLDVGAGSGSFAHILSLLGYDVTALDASEDALNEIQFRYNDLHVLNALANHTHDFGKEQFDVIIASSLLHEVFSYGDDVHKAGHISSLSRALNSFKEALKPEGLLLIRDGVKPENWKESASFELLAGHENSSVNLYLEMCPFANGIAYGDAGSLIRLTNTENSTWVGNVQSVMEFAYTYTWGLDSYPRETQELYAPLTLLEYNALLSDTGFKVEESYSYLQTGYPTNLVERMTYLVNGKPAQWPDSNAIWVSHKS